MAGRVRIRDSLAFGWRTFRRNTLFFIVLLVVLGIPLAILGALVGKIPPAGADPSRLFLELALWSLRGLAAMVIIVVSLSFLDRGAFDMERLKGMKPLVIPYIVGTFLLFSLVSVGLALLVVPGVYVAIRFQFTPYLIVDRGMGPIEAFKAAWSMTRGLGLELFLFLLSIVGLNILGAVPLGLGLLITVPVVFLAHAMVYRDLASQP